MLFLETGCVPFRDLIRKRRILFLYYILNENADSILKKFPLKQIKSKKPRDWINQVLADLKELEIETSLENLKKMSKSRLKLMINEAIKRKAFKSSI